MDFYLMVAIINSFIALIFGVSAQFIPAAIPNGVVAIVYFVLYCSDKGIT